MISVWISGGRSRKVVPSIQTCVTLMDEYGMLAHIRAHSLVVSRVAQLLVRSLNKTGLHLSPELTVAAALLHDIGKTESLKTGQDHAELGRQICRRHGLQEVSELVAEHVRLKHHDWLGSCTEKEIVYYSDKRVNHDRIVSLDGRMAYILERYGGNQDWIRRRIRENFEFCRRVEEKLFAGLGFGPESVPNLVKLEAIDTQRIGKE
jgi:putative nucleotidyltransferase with HDIG domain